MNILLPSSLTGRTDIILPKTYTSGFSFYPDSQNVEKYLKMDEAQIIEECSNYHISAMLVHELWRTGRNQTLFNLFKAGAELDTKEFVSINAAMITGFGVSTEEAFSFITDVELDQYKARTGKTYEEELTKEEYENLEATRLNTISLVGQKVSNIQVRKQEATE